MRDKLSTLIGFTVLTVLLTAGAAQSLAGANTVFTDDIVDGTIRHADVKADSLGGSRILHNAVTGTDVNEATLVPTCRAGLTRVGDVCYGLERSLATQVNALNDCANEALRLPTMGEGRAVAVHIGMIDSLWTDSPDAYVTTNSWGNLNPGGARTYRCVTSVGARP